MSTYEKYCYDITLKPDIQLITGAYTYRHKSSSVLIFLARCQRYLLINNFLCQRDGKCVDNVLQMHTNWKVFQTVFLKHMFFVLFILEWSGWDFSADRIGSIQNISTPFIDHRDYSKKSYETGFRSVKQKNPKHS